MSTLKEKIQYPKLLLLLISILAAYFLFQLNSFKDFSSLLNGKGYISIFIAGMLFSYGFTAPFAVGFFVQLAPQVSILPAALVAAVGSVISDMCIFRFIRASFSDELDKLKLTFLFQKIRALFDNHLSSGLKQYVLWTLAGFLIASPLPDEFGVSLISGFTRINQTVFALLAFTFNFFGIFVVLSLASV